MTTKKIKLTKKVCEVFNNKEVPDHYRIKNAIVRLEKVLNEMKLKKLPSPFLKENIELKILESLTEDYKNIGRNLTEIKQNSKVTREIVRAKINIMKEQKLVTLKGGIYDEKKVVVKITNKGLKLYREWEEIYRRFNL